LVDTLDLKSNDHCGRAGSSPAPSTLRIRNKLFYMMLRIFLFMKNILQSFLVKKSMV
jgi:hypothetical protein